MTSSPPFSLISVIEALLFASQKPLLEKEILAALRAAAAAHPEDSLLKEYAQLQPCKLMDLLQELESAYRESGRAFDLKETATGWQLVTRPAFAPWVRQLFPESRPARLSAPALETLAIIAYRQPLTRAELESVRGVAVEGVIQTLLDRQFIRIAGRAEIPGRPLLYETTHIFLEHFGLKSLNELPNAHELRRVPILQQEKADASTEASKPEFLLTHLPREQEKSVFLQQETKIC